MVTFYPDTTEKPIGHDDVKDGLNKIWVQTAHYGMQPMIMEKNVPLKMQDGVTLRFNLFRPDKPGKYPAILSLTSYGKDAIGQESYDRLACGVAKASIFAGFECPDPGFWVPNDYATILIDTRGTGASEGILNHNDIKEARDFAEVIEWTAKQNWCSGNIGTGGVSYLSTTQWWVATLNPEPLKAIMPWEGKNDYYREWTTHGGIPETFFSHNWVNMQTKRWNRKIESMPEHLKEHPLFDEFWESKKVPFEKITVPCYVGGGWTSQGLHNRGNIEGYKYISSKNKWMELQGRKYWEYYFLRETLERQKRFYDYFLKGIENDWMDTPRVRIEVRDRFYEGLWRFENDWPIPGTKATALYLDGKNMSMSSSKVKDEAKVSYNVDKENTTANKTAIFKMKFDKDVQMAGHFKARLWVSADGNDDLDLFVALKKYDRQGNELFMADMDNIENGVVASGWLRVSHRELDPAKSTPLQPVLKHTKIQKLKEGEIVPVEIEIWPTAIMFHTGESLALVVKGSDIVTEYLPPRFRSEHKDTINKGMHNIYTGGKYDSHLLLPVIPSK